MDPVVILNFHGLGEPPRTLDPGEDEVWLDRPSFEAALDVAAADPAARITFDDGNLSDRTIALDALLRRGLTATFFLPAGMVGRAGFLGEADVRSLVAAGMTIGSHGMSHRSWRGLGEEDLRDEIEEARDRLAAVAGRKVTEAACPFGEYDRRVLDRLREAGFTRVHTSDRGPADPDAWIQPRNTIHRGDGPADVARILAARPSGIAALARSARLTVKRWR